MALNLTPEQKEIGKANTQRAMEGLAGNKDLTRRDFIKSVALTGAVVAPLSAAAYYQYSSDKVDGKPVKVALIGAGDEGGVLIGEHNPKYVEVVAVCDIRPTNQKRIFEGDPDWAKKKSPRKGLNFHYGANCDKSIKVYEDYRKMLDERKDVEAVIIALPLFLHAPVAIDCMRAGKHVLCEKLMAWNITQCKEMIAVAKETDRLLSIGHQRHYSMLYAHAVDVMHSGILGEVRHIRALWHRNNARPRLGKDGKPMVRDGLPLYIDSWKKDVPEADRKALDGKVKQYGYKSLEELVQWRLHNRTGGGLMAELGSHQLDACSIFLGKVHPLAVSGVGGKFFYKDDREVEDHVFVTFEFPGPNYFASPDRKKIKDRDDVVVVTYSSISTNSFEPYGECVMGTKGTMIVEQEQELMLYAGSDRNTSASVVAAGGQPALEASASGPPTATARTLAGTGSGPVSRGYTQEMEHFAYCIRMWEQGMSKEDRPQVRCHGTAAMADAIIALTSNIAMRTHKRIEFQEEWFDPTSKEVPDKDSKPEIITA
jgi:predicted dehydrogenase